VVKLVLDTHVLVWWMLDDRRLKGEARRAIAAADIVWVSVASGLEASIKIAKGRLRIAEPFRMTLAADDFTELPLTLRHAEELERLPHHHADPFDRILVAQARVEGATIVSHDRDLEPYGVPMIWT
jgi:PIN domain nuclease of toxin-antitoxin system